MLLPSAVPPACAVAEIVRGAVPELEDADIDAVRVAGAVIVIGIPAEVVCAELLSVALAVSV